MQDIKKIFAFGWPYLRRYWVRLVLGVLLGILFGFSNASFVWATKTLFERLDRSGSSRQIVLSADSNTVFRVVHGTNAEPGFLASANGESNLVVSADMTVQVVVPRAKVEEDPTAGTGELTLRKRLTAIGKSIGAFFKPVGDKLNKTIDAWLPLMGREVDWKQKMGGLLFLPILVFMRGYIGYLSSYFMAWVSERVIRDLRLDLITKLNTLSLDFFNRTTIGELLARVNGDTGALYRCLSLGFSDLIKEPVSIIGILILLFSMDWKLTLLAVVFTPLTVIPIKILGKKVRKAITSTLHVGASQDSLLVEVYSNIRVVKAFCLETLQVNRFRQIYDNLVRIGMKSVQARELVNPMVETISMMGLGVVIVFIFANQITIPKLVAFLTGVVMMYTPLKKLASLHVYFQQASVGANRLVEIFKEQPTVKEKPDAEPLPSFERELKFEDARFAYRIGHPVVKDLNLTIPRGQKLGIAGESGCGKSTLVNLIFRFYDTTRGRITIDGHDLRNVRIFDLRQQMALVSQDVVIFDQSVADNIACGRAGATREDVEAAARAAFAHDFIMQLPQKYETRLGERGNTLSGGQKQRIAIARAFVRNAPILVLDEATAALDPKAEGEVQAAIDRLAENRTVICIAHRLSTLASMDHILVLKEGSVVEQGKFSELLEKGGIFAGMARKQGIYTPSVTA